MIRSHSDNAKLIFLSQLFWVGIITEYHCYHIVCVCHWYTTEDNSCTSKTRVTLIVSRYFFIALCWLPHPKVFHYLELIITSAQVGRNTCNNKMFDSFMCFILFSDFTDSIYCVYRLWCCESDLDRSDICSNLTVPQLFVGLWWQRFFLHCRGDAVNSCNTAKQSDQYEYRHHKHTIEMIIHSCCSCEIVIYRKSILSLQLHIMA